MRIKKIKCIDLTLSVLAILVGRHMVDGVAWWAVRGGAVGLRAGQGGESRHRGNTGETLQALDMIHALTAAGSHAGRGLKAACQRGDGIVTLGLMWHTTRVQQAHHLKRRKKRKEKKKREGKVSFSFGMYFVLWVLRMNLMLRELIQLTCVQRAEDSDLLFVCLSRCHQ